MAQEAAGLFLGYLDQMLPGTIMGAASLAVWYLKQLAKNVSDLNLKMAVFVDRITSIAEHLEDHESRIRDLESTSKK